MRNTILSTVILLGLGLTACNTNRDKRSQLRMADTTKNITTENMENLVSIVELPVSDFSRAVKFYEELLGIKIEEADMGGTHMGVLPSDGKTVSVVLVKGDDYNPSTDGAVVYLNAGKDLQTVLEKVEKNGGKILVPKTEISPEMGFFAMFLDTEGNKLGLHSSD